MNMYSHCHSQKHVGENVSLFVKEKSLIESISGRGERERILDSIKVTVSPIGAPLAGELFTQTVCLCMKESERARKRERDCELSICASLSWGWTHFSHPPQGRLALLRVETHTHADKILKSNPFFNLPDWGAHARHKQFKAQLCYGRSFITDHVDTHEGLPFIISAPKKAPRCFCPFGPNS